MTTPSTPRRLAPAVAFAVLGAVAIAGAGLIAGRADLVAVGIPLALWAAIALLRPRRERPVEVTLQSAPPSQDGWLDDEIRVQAEAELVQLAVIQSDRRVRTVVLTPDETVSTSTRSLHSGPVISVRVQARTADADAGLLTAADAPRRLVRTVAPPLRPLPRLPLPLRLTGLHGAHDGPRPGQGGDFRDIHPFVPGDELRRVDWRATARAARRPGDLLVRRTDTLSDASVVIAMDTADDLGAVVASWGTGDLRRSGATSLDRAREAARAVASAAVDRGDRVAFHALAPGGRSVRSGAGARHLARVTAAIAATGQTGDDTRYRRAPIVPHGSIVCVLSNCFDGAAAELALMWRASGHRVLAIDTLPELDTSRLSIERRLALRILLAERDDMVEELTTAGVDVLAWRDDPVTALTVIARTRSAAR